MVGAELLVSCACILAIADLAGRLADKAEVAKSIKLCMINITVAYCILTSHCSYRFVFIGILSRLNSA
jgi:hypothetical protein